MRLIFGRLIFGLLNPFKRSAADAAGAHGESLRRQPVYGIPLRRIVIVMVLMLLSLTGVGLWLWQVNITRSVIEASVDAGLRLERIEIEGRINTPKGAITDATGIEWYQPILTLDLEQIHDSLLDIGWIRAVRVERHIPSTLVIIIDERKAVALLQNDGGHHVIDRHGEIIKGVNAEDFTHLPVVKGDKAAENSSSVINLLKGEPDVFAEVWSLTYQSGRRWDVFLRNNIRIQLPEEDIAAAWMRFAEMNRKHNLIGRDVVSIDLRYHDKLIIRPSRPSQKGSST